MAAVVSHAMRRFSTNQSDPAYPYGVTSEGSGKGWPVSENGESALSRSMRYADPWLYGSVRASSGLVLAPAFLLCNCTDYVAGTKSKKSPTTCKKCKGTRLPFSAKDSKFGTVRCYPTSSSVGTMGTPIKAGTMRVVSSSRASILPSADPYDLMRRSRLSVSESTTHFRARSISPSKTKTPEARSHSTTRLKNSTPEGYPTSKSRRSILECDINPYELMSVEPPKNILLNGQRIRISQPTEKESVDPPKVKKNATPQNFNEKENECNRFKSILKKPTTFSDTDSNSREGSPSPARKSGSHFYLPMPGTPRKKVQFLVENCNEPHMDPPPPSPPSKQAQKPKTETPTESPSFCKLRRSESERFNQDVKKIVFHDSMALRSKKPRSELPMPLEEEILKRLDGLLRNTKKETPSLRPVRRPPPPPVQKPAPDSMSGKKIPDEKIGKKLNNAETVIREVKEIEVKKAEGKNNDAVTKSMNLELDTNGNSKPVLKEECHNVKNAQIAENNKKPHLPTGPPSAPPRKRSSNKQPPANNIPQTSPVIYTKTNDKMSAPISEHSNRTVVQINGSPTIHKLQIKNELTDVVNVRTVSVTSNPQRKTSILITGDDCYSTVNVNDDVPIYQSSVVVKDTAPEANAKRNSSSVYITGNFLINTVEDDKVEVSKRDDNSLLDTFNESDIPTSDLLKELLKDPVEAVRRNLVPHVCGKSDLSGTPQPETPTETSNFQDFLNDSLLKYENLDDSTSEHSSSTQYELMDSSLDGYTDHSNRSSVTEEDLSNRTKFYELLADSALIEVSDTDDHHYESIKVNPDPIYEEIEIPPPLPANPPPMSLLDDLHLDKEYTTRSIFEGASKYDILSYLVDAKERGIVQEDTYNFSFNGETPPDDETKEFSRVCQHISDSSEDNSLIIPPLPMEDKTTKSAEVERNDSGVGSETSKSSLSKYRTRAETATICEDCETTIDNSPGIDPLLCRKCSKKRSERKEIITEIVETEEKYSRDLQIILEEFYQPMLVAGLLTAEQLSAIFLNAEELLENSQALAERLRDAVEIAGEQGDEDLLTVNIGKLFLEAAPMLHGFETYCVRQGSASLLLASLEKEKELLRIFLRVSQMENTMLRRMNLNSFLMVPVQRVTKYPLLLARLYKVTPNHYETKAQLKEAQHKIELHLNHMNSETKDVPSKLWRRIGSSSGRRASTEMDLAIIKLRKIAVDVLEWNHDEAKFALEGKLLFTQPTDNNWRKGRTIKLTPVNALLVINGKPIANRAERTEENGLVFSRHSAIREAALLLVRDKNGRYSLLREPLYLDRCVIAADPAWQSYFEVQELLGKDTFIFKAEDEDKTKVWYTQLQFHAQGMGAWRKRRNALANIMINGMGLRS